MFHMDTPAVTRRTYGGSLVILGVLVLFVGLFLADSAAMLFKTVPGFRARGHPLLRRV
jgi:hypothetical protein